MMGKMGLVHTCLRELLSFGRAPRVPEPSAVMDIPDEVESYTAAGRELGIMAPTYLFHTAQACDVIRPGDKVLDLACGPGTQLAQLAELNPDVEFVGVDLSQEMLQQARSHVDGKGLSNVLLQVADISDLTAFPDADFDVVVSSMSLHHLPELSLLEATLKEASRVLRNDGGVYLADFGRLKSIKSMRFFAYRDEYLQPAAFTKDYYNSLRAAFSVSELKSSLDASGLPSQVYCTHPIPFMIAAKSRPRRTAETEMVNRLKRIRESLSSQAEKDLRSMIQCFRVGGLRTDSLS